MRRFYCTVGWTPAISPTDCFLKNTGRKPVDKSGSLGGRGAHAGRDAVAPQVSRLCLNFRCLAGPVFLTVFVRLSARFSPFLEWTIFGMRVPIFRPIVAGCQLLVLCMLIFPADPREQFFLTTVPRARFEKMSLQSPAVELD